MARSHDPLAWIDDELRELERHDLRRRLQSYSRPAAAVVESGGKRFVNFGSNDYLGLATDPRLGEAASRAVRTSGWGGGASPLVTGHLDLHATLQTQLAEFEATEAALLFASGYAANSGTIAALMGPGDVVFSDEKNHASIIDGCRLSRAKVRIYRHVDCHDLAAQLNTANGYRRRLIVTDTLFSMDGNLAPLTELIELAERHDAMLMVDEAHATGVFGARGRGVAEHLGVEELIPIRIGTLSKALGASGGFVCGSRRLIDWLVNRARPYIFSTAPPPAGSAAALAALEAIASVGHPGRELLARAEQLRQRLVAQGWNVGSSASQVVPLIVGDAQAALQLADELRQRGFLCPAIRPPSVSPGTARLRLGLSMAHTPEMLDGLCQALAELAPQLQPASR